MVEKQDEVRDRAVQYMEKIKGISDARTAGVNEIAGGTLVTVRLKKDGVESWGWYFEKRDVKKALFTGEEIAKFISGELTSRTILNSILDVFSAKDSYSVSLRFLGIGLVVTYFGFLFSENGKNVFVFLIAMAIAVLLIIISARVYFSDFRAPDVIPEKDRELLVEIIKDSGKDGLETYIRLSSLYGVTGNITKLGLSGLPLITVALTVFFTGLAALLWALANHADSTIVANMMDLAKLTLGAFIGSFVQRNVSASSAAAKPGVDGGSNAHSL